MLNVLIYLILYQQTRIHDREINQGLNEANVSLFRTILNFLLLSAFVLILASCTNEIYTNLDQRQANEIVATLLRHNIPAERVSDDNGRYSVQVSTERFADATVILDQAGLPRQEFTNLGEVFKSNGIIASPVQERAQMIYALSQELARTVYDIDGVLSARVHLVLPENDPLRQQLIPSSASVFIRHPVSVSMSELIPQIKMLVANGVAGLSYDKVSVVNIAVPESKSNGEAESEPKFVNFYGIWVHPDSVGRAQGLVYGLLGVLMVVVAAVAVGMSFRAKRNQIYALGSEPGTKTQ